MFRTTIDRPIIWIISNASPKVASATCGAVNAQTVHVMLCRNNRIRITKSTVIDTRMGLVFGGYHRRARVNALDCSRSRVQLTVKIVCVDSGNQVATHPMGWKCPTPTLILWFAIVVFGWSLPQYTGVARCACSGFGFVRLVKIEAKRWTPGGSGHFANCIFRRSQEWHSELSASNAIRAINYLVANIGTNPVQSGPGWLWHSDVYF